MEGVLALMIPIFALTIPIVAIVTKHQQKLAEMRHSTQAQLGNDQSEAKLRALEDRVRVLERIVTDKNSDLAGQIDALGSRETLPH